MQAHGGRLDISRATLRTLTAFAWRLQSFQVSSPAFVRSESPPNPSACGYVGQVIDRTGRLKNVNVTLRWAPDEIPPDTPSIFTAVQEQLGLKLQPGKGPIKFLVIDHAEEPTEN